ncbi:MAG: preprotein translocase subunit SecG [Chloroflexota bacterium]
MLAFISIILIIIAILLIGVVLLQPGKGDMMTGMGGLTNTFSSMFGTRRATDILSKTTIGLALAILLISLLTNLFFVGGGETAPKPVTEGVELPSAPANPGQALPPAQQPAQPEKK